MERCERLLLLFLLLFLRTTCSWNKKRITIVIGHYVFAFSSLLLDTVLERVKDDGLMGNYSQDMSCLNDTVS